MINIVIFSDMVVYATPQWGKICLDTSFNTIIMDNSHTPQMMMVRHQMFILMLTVQFTYYMCCGVQVIFYTFLLNICEASLQNGPYVASKINRVYQLIS